MTFAKIWGSKVFGVVELSEAARVSLIEKGRKSTQLLVASTMGTLEGKPLTMYTSAK